MGLAKFSEIFVPMCLLWATCICIVMAQSQGPNFNFTKFKACNTDKILCVHDAAISGNVIQLSNSTTREYKLTNKTAGRVVYNETIHLSSTASFSTRIQFSMKNYNLSSDDGGDGIAFFMASTENDYMAPSVASRYGLPGNGTDVFHSIFAVILDSWRQRVSIYGSNFYPVYSLNMTYLNQSLNSGTVWNAWIDYNGITQNVEVFLSNTTNSLKIRKNCVLSHAIDSFVDVGEYVAIGISASARWSSETHTIISWSFNSSLYSKNKSRNKVSTSTKIILTVGSVVVTCMAGAVMVWGYFRKKMLGTANEQAYEDNGDIEIDSLLDHGPRKFNLDDLKVGTDNFSETRKLGQGGFGGVYKGNLVDASEIVAIKRISKGSRQGLKEFISEVTIVSRLRHRNLVQLLGWCQEGGELLLVYEYMPNGSLDKHLFSEGDHPALQWIYRYQIAREIASGLLYLHEERDQCVVHRDVKSSNVMLDCNFSAKLGDFGLARMLEINRLSQTTMAAGTFGYLAPECLMTGRTSPESDVYSFGAVALEIASGRRALDVRMEEQNMRLVEWVWDLYGKGRVLEAADERLDGQFEIAEMKRLMVVGLWCSHPDSSARPKMRQVLKLLKLEAQVPILPRAMPVPTYTAFQQAMSSGASSGPPYAGLSLPSSSSPATASSEGVSISTQVSSSSISGTVAKAVHFQQQA